MRPMRLYPSVVVSKQSISQVTVGRFSVETHLYVRALFEAADIDPKAELVKLRDAGCTFGGVPVPHAPLERQGR